MKNWKNRKLLIGVLLVYGLACALPAWWRHGEPVYGIVCLLNPLALLTPYWWANPLFFAGCVALAKGRAFRAMALGIVATALATSFFPLHSIEGARAGLALHSGWRPWRAWRSPDSSRVGPRRARYSLRIDVW